MKYSDKEILQHLKGSRRQRHEIFKYLYLSWPPRRKIASYLRKKGLNPTESEDVYKDALVALDQAVQMGRYNEEKSPVAAYVFGICRYLWIKRLKKSKERLKIEETGIDTREQAFINQIFDDELRNNLEEVLSQLTPRCRHILRLWSRAYSMKEISKQMEYANENVARKSKHQCLKALENLIMNNPGIKKRLNPWK